MVLKIISKFYGIEKHGGEIGVVIVSFGIATERFYNFLIGNQTLFVKYLTPFVDFG